MGRMSTSMKVEQTRKLRSDMRYCMISTSSVDWCLANAKGQALNFISTFFAQEAGRRRTARIANMVRNAGFPAIKCIDDYDMSAHYAGQIREIIYKLFLDNGVEIPYNRLEVDLRSVCDGRKREGDDTPDI